MIKFDGGVSLVFERRLFILAGTSASMIAMARVGIAHERTYTGNTQVGDLDALIPEYDLPEEFLPREVALATPLPPYEIHVMPSDFALYWTLPGDRAIRYGVGIGRPGLYHAGVYTIGVKKEWPTWKPTPQMARRNPTHYGIQEVMPGGPANPLGSRALYLFNESGRDTFMRIHGTNDPKTIGIRVSNGCARLTNDLIIDLYNRVPVGTRIVLHPTPEAETHPA